MPLSIQNSPNLFFLNDTQKSKLSKSRDMVLKDYFGKT